MLDPTGVTSAATSSVLGSLRAEAPTNPLLRAQYDFMQNGLTLLSIAGSLVGAAPASAARGGASTLESAAGSVFWSGGRGAERAAAAFAARGGGSTLEMTASGRAIQAAQLPWSQAAPLWRSAAMEFASSARGTIDVFLGRAARADSIWTTVERPALVANPAVTGIRTHLAILQ